MTDERRIALKKELSARDGCACVWCGAEMPLRKLTLDHVLTKSRGGSSWPGNLLLACFDCNGARADTGFGVWTELMRERGSCLREEVIAAAQSRQRDPRTRKKAYGRWLRRRAAELSAAGRTVASGARPDEV
jgi:hypothetical protein